MKIGFAQKPIRLLSLTVCACLLGELTVPAQTSQTQIIQEPARILSQEEIIQLEDAVFQEINDFRVSKGLGPLRKSDVIGEIARQHSQDMAGGIVGFGHDGFNERARQVRVQLDPTLDAFAENVFAISSNYSQNLAHAITLGWLKSSRHHKNIVGRYTISGLGIYQATNGLLYVTQFFASSTDQQSF